MKFFIYTHTNVFWATPVILGDNSWLCAEESLLILHKGPYRVQGFELGSVVCKADTLLTVLSLKPLQVHFLLSE